MKTYGDLAKTKTITLRKQARIIKTLQGQESNNHDSSKFRFWVKSKAFTDEKPQQFKELPIFGNEEVCRLYVPNNTSKVSIFFLNNIIISIVYFPRKFDNQKLDPQTKI